MLQLADVFSKIEDPQRRAALASTILSKSYSDMLPLLIQNSNALRDQLQTGQAMVTLTTEQAKAAAAFNDKLDSMGNQFLGMKSKIAIGITRPFADMAEVMSAAIDRVGVFSGVIDGYANGIRKYVYGVGGGLTTGLDSINAQIATAKEALAKEQDGGFLGRNSADEIAAQKELNALLVERSAMLERISADRKKPFVPDAKVDDAAINAVIKLGDATDQTAKKVSLLNDTEARRKEGINNIIETLKFEIDLTGQSTEQQHLLSDIRQLTSKSTDAESEAIKKLITTKYDLVEADAILAEGEKLAAKQRADSAAEYDRLNQKFNSKSLSLNSGISDALDARASGIIPDDTELKRVLDQMGKEFNGVEQDAKHSTDQMSEYAIQAARSMQSSFSDFLFDPFAKGAASMGETFLNTIKRMAADAASAQIMEGLFGKTGSGSGLVGSAVSGVGSLFAGLFHDGGIVGSGGGTMSVHPSVFAGAMRYHAGGVAGLAPNEVPAILQRGELVISNKQLAKRQSGGNSVESVNNNNITVYVQAQKGESSSETGMRVGESVMRAIAKEEIKTAARPGNQLNQTTKFG